MTEILIASPGSDLPFPKSLPEFMRGALQHAHLGRRRPLTEV